MKNNIKFIYKVLINKLYKKYGYSYTYFAINDLKSANDDLKQLFISYLDSLESKKNKS